MRSYENLRLPTTHRGRNAPISVDITTSRVACIVILFPRDPWDNSEMCVHSPSLVTRLSTQTGVVTSDVTCANLGPQILWSIVHYLGSIVLYSLRSWEVFPSTLGSISSAYRILREFLKGEFNVMWTCFFGLILHHFGILVCNCIDHNPHVFGSIVRESGKYCFGVWEVFWTTLGSIDIDTKFLRVPCLPKTVCRLEILRWIKTVCSNFKNS